jgi:dihydroorotase
MNLIIRKATIIDPQSPFHNQTVDLKITEGVIEKIGVSIPNADTYQEFQQDGLHISQGWFDTSISLGEPGFEDRETIANGLDVAAKSGFTGIALQPNSYPIIDNQSQVHFVKQKAANSATDLFPIGALTKGSEGKDLAELFDMKNAGAVAFGDYGKSMANANLLKIGLQYVQDFNGLVIAFCQDETIKGNGVANEGIVSTGLGLKGIPVLAEELNLQRNLAILEYTGGKLHIPTVSTKVSVELLKKAKANGLNVTCGVAAVNLFLDDTSLLDFDTNYKVNPPLRSKKDVQALRNGITNGVIDVIVSDHLPQDIESKDLEFDLADFGMINLQTAFSCALEGLKDKNIEILVKSLSDNAYPILGLKIPEIKEGSAANLTVFSVKETTTLTEKTNYSKSKNSPFFNKPLAGKVIGVVNGTKSYFN